MHKGKVSEITYNRSVLRKISHKTEYLKSGVSSTAIELEGVTFVMSSNCIVKYFSNCESYYIHKTLNGIYEKNAIPRFLKIDINIPENFEEKKLGNIIKNFNSEAERYNLSIEQCQVYAGSVENVIIYVTIVGIEKAGVTPDIDDNCSIVMTKSINVMGTAILSNLYKEKLLKQFSSSFVDNCLELNNYLSIEKESRVAWDNNAEFIYAAGEGGIFGAFWNLASTFGKGITINMEKIPVWQETIEVAELMEINPYTCDGTGALLIVTKKGEEMVTALENKGITAGIVGRFTNTNDRIVMNNQETRFLEPPRGDEIYKLI